MYDGRNGLTRNVQAAVEYFRLGAAQNDASSHFGYGLALLKVDYFSLRLFIDNIQHLGTRYKTKSHCSYSTY